MWYWILGVVAVVLGFAYFLKHTMHVFEDEHQFYLLLAGFFVLYIGAAFFLGYTLPEMV